MNKTTHRFKVTFNEDDALSCAAIALAEYGGFTYAAIEEYLGMSKGKVSYRLHVGAKMDKLPMGFGYARMYRSGLSDEARRRMRQIAQANSGDVAERLGGRRVKAAPRFTSVDVSQRALTVTETARLLRRRKRQLAVAA